MSTLDLHEASGQGKEAVQGIGHTMQVDLRPGTGQGGGIGFALVAQRIILGGDDQRARLMGQIIH